MKRSGPLRRLTGLARRSRLSPVSARRKAIRSDRDEIRERVFRRDAFRCRLDRRSPFYVVEAPHFGCGPCYGPLTPHHVRKASQGGAYSVENLVALCAQHNSWVEIHPDSAYRLGLVRRRGDPLTFEETVDRELRETVLDLDRQEFERRLGRGSTGGLDG